MRCLTVTTVLAATCLAGTSAPGQADTVAQWARLLDSADPAESAQAESALRALASGELTDPRTREASFALAEHFVVADDLAARPAAMQEIAAAASLFAEDPRAAGLLEILAAAQVEAGDGFGAHLSYSQLLKSDPAVLGPATLARAAENAARIGDSARALEWSARVDLDAVGLQTARPAHLARLIAGERLGRFETALESARWLDEDDAETLRYDAAGLRAAARTLAAVGLLDEAIERYELLVNLHPALDDHDAALQQLASLLVRVGRQSMAPHYLGWLVEAHPYSIHARTARLDQLELSTDPEAGPPIDGYLKIVRQSEDLVGAREACKRLVDRALGAGLALEMMTALTRLAGADGELDPPLAALAARDAASLALDPALELLSSRRDDLAVAAVSVQAERLELPIPAGRRPAVDAARSRLGLPPTRGGVLEQTIDEARTALEERRLAEAIEQLEFALRFAHKPDPRSSARAAGLLAEALWRDGRSDDALDWIGRAMQLDPEGPARPMHVLHADILFSVGKKDDACAAYSRAASMGDSRWVALQLDRCPSAEASTTSGEQS